MLVQKRNAGVGQSRQLRATPNPSQKARFVLRVFIFLKILLVCLGAVWCLVFVWCKMDAFFGRSKLRLGLLWCPFGLAKKDTLESMGPLEWQMGTQEPSESPSRNVKGIKTARNSQGFLDTVSSLQNTVCFTEEAKLNQ